MANCKMDVEQLRQLVSQPCESAKLDFKLQLYKINEPKPTISTDVQKWSDAKEQQWAEMVKDILALTNGNIGTVQQTGYLIIGADDKLKSDGNPNLQDVGNEAPTRKEIYQKVNSYCDPRIPNLDCEIVLLDGQRLFVVSIPPSPHIHRLSKQLKTPKKEFSPHTVLIRRGDGEEIYPASPDEQTALRQEQERVFGAQIIPQQTISIDWQQVCREMLNCQKQLTLNDLMVRDGVSIDLHRLFVPLGLVERKLKRFGRKDVESAELGSRLYEPAEEEIVQRFDDSEEFFSQIIRDRNTPKGKRVVIIGEPGAGKTTLLQKISDRFHENNLVPIWISLKKVGTKLLQDYLLKDWLRDATQALQTASPEWKPELENLLKTGRVCLLLDGVDEMTVANPLRSLRDQLLQYGWAEQVQVVLTCRLNTWESEPLDKFTIYRTLDFNYPEQVKQFITNFFNREEADLKLGETLKQELEHSDKGRIQDSVKNPLRLSLLCYVWETGIGTLPDTKAELYKLFVDYFYDFYELKHPEWKIQPDDRKKLNLQLGEVAKIALDNQQFCLPASDIINLLGNPKQEGSLFWKACQLGWLNYIGKVAENPFEDAYAFFHTTFQEYFAAVAIDNDWSYFLKHTSGNLEHSDASYRVFESQWKEVFLLWLGLNHKENLMEAKQKLVRALVDFKDECGEWSKIFGVDKGFYEFRACFLLASGISEFVDKSRSDEIIEQIFNWSLGFYTDEHQQAYSYWDPILESAVSALQEIDTERVIPLLCQLIQNSLCRSTLSKAADILKKIAKNDSYSIHFLVDLALQTCDSYVQSLIIGILGEISSNSPEVIDALTQLLLKESENDLRKRLIAKNLGKVDESNLLAIQTLECLCNSQDGNVRRLAAKSLWRIDKDNHSSVVTLESLCSSQDKQIKLLATLNLIEIQLSSQTIILSLEELCMELEDNFDRMIAAKALKKINKSNKIAIVTLENLSQSRNSIIQERANWILNDLTMDKMANVDSLIEKIMSSDDQSIYLQAADDLKAVLIEDQMPKIVSSLKSYLTSQVYKDNFLRFYVCYQIVWHCAQNMSYPEFCRAWHGPSSATA